MESDGPSPLMVVWVLDRTWEHAYIALYELLLGLLPLASEVVVHGLRVCLEEVLLVEFAARLQLFVLEDEGADPELVVEYLLVVEIDLPALHVLQDLLVPPHQHRRLVLLGNVGLLVEVEREQL